MKITLASASPRRRELIKKIPRLIVDVVPSDADENVSASTPEELVTELALKKSKAVFDKTGGIVVGADTVVASDGKIFGKPKSVEEARSFFRLLCRRTHEVMTGIAVVTKDKIKTACEISRVTFYKYDEKLIETYIASGSPFDKAGGYGIQDEGLKPLIKSVEGDLDNIIGLPVKLLENTLEEFF